MGRNLVFSLTFHSFTDLTSIDKNATITNCDYIDYFFLLLEKNFDIKQDQ